MCRIYSGCDSDRLSPVDSPRSQLIPSSRYSAATSLLHDQFVSHYSSGPGAGLDRALQFSSSLLDSDQPEDRWFNTNRLDFQTSAYEAAAGSDLSGSLPSLLPYTVSSTTRMDSDLVPESGTTGATLGPYSAAQSGWESRGASLPTWISETNCDRYLSEDGNQQKDGPAPEVCEKDKEAMDSGWEETPSSVKSVDSGDSGIFEQAKRKRMSPPVSEEHSPLKTDLLNPQDEARSMNYFNYYSQS